MKKSTIFILLVLTIVASLFYAAVWTCDDHSLSSKFFLTGIVAVGHFVFSLMTYNLND